MKPARPRPLTDAKDDEKVKAAPKRKAPKGKTRDMKPASGRGYKTR